MADTLSGLSRSEPFIRCSWLSDFLPFDPIKDSTFCEFESCEQLYEYLSDYIVKQTDQSYRFTPVKNASKATRILEKLARIAKQKKDSESLGDDAKQQTDADSTNADEDIKKVNVKMGLGLHEFTFDNEKFYAVNQVIGRPCPSFSGKPTLYKSLVLFVQGRGKMQTLKRFCEKLVEQNESKQDSLFFNIYRFDVARSYWRKSGKKIARDIKTIILPEETSRRVMSDFERFTDEQSISWYFAHGIPYKRSYLFYGVPGSGKSSLIQALAAKYDRNLAFLQPSNPKMTDETFKTCIQSAPGNSLIVLEDIDALFNKDRSKKDNSCPLTFSGLLNGLDGVGNPDGQIFIMTTNFVERLDDALIRSGRVDLHIEFPLATDEQLRKMFLLFYPESEDLADGFCREIRAHFKDGISMAAVQQHFIQNMFVEPKLIIERVRELGGRLDVVTRFDEKQEKEVKKKAKKGKVEEEVKQSEETVSKVESTKVASGDVADEKAKESEVVKGAKDGKKGGKEDKEVKTTVKATQ